jgi:NAD(P)-dependent dehydrogenase (short-subunit alcohol dehydrogenase family)
LRNKTFEGAVAIVTGGAHGIGRALCEALANHGAIVTIADIDCDTAQQLALTLTRAGHRVEAVMLDVSRASDVERIVGDVASRHGRLDFIFNNAAVAVAGELRDLSPRHFQRVIAVNVLGVVHGTMAAYRLMLRQQAGHIINVSSITGLLPSPLLTAYSATKHAVVGFSTALRIEAATLGVSVSVACPGLVDTQIHERTEYLNVRKEDFLAQLPRRLMVTPAQAARAILHGVARNQPIIIHPLSARLGWWLYRLCPALVEKLMQRTVRQFRKIRVAN